jgi:predicted GNAT superfamily acetyltransferase
MASFKDYFRLCILEKPQEMIAVEELQRVVWPGSETEVVPGNLLVAAVHSGGLVIGAYQIAVPEANDRFDYPALVLQEIGELPAAAKLVGFVFGFPGFDEIPDGLRPKHYSHMLAVNPAVGDLGIGFTLKRAQWQMVRHVGIDRINWTFDPLQSRNAYLNISRLGAVCNTYIEDAYGAMLDGLNAGLPSDRFLVDWWVNTPRVNRRLSRRPRLQLDLAHYLSAGVEIINPSWFDADGLPHPLDREQDFDLLEFISKNSMLLLEIPVDFQRIKSLDMNLALAWRYHARVLFQKLFEQGFLATDFVRLADEPGRSFYVLSHGELTL